MYYGMLVGVMKDGMFHQLDGWKILSLFSVFLKKNIS